VIVSKVEIAGIDGDALTRIVEVQIKELIANLSVSKFAVNVVTNLLEGHAAQSGAILPEVVENNVPFQIGVRSPRRERGRGGIGNLIHRGKNKKKSVRVKKKVKEKKGALTAPPRQHPPRIAPNALRSHR